MAGGGKIRAKSLGRKDLKKGPGLYEDAMEAARLGDATTAVELLKELQDLLELSDDEFGKMIAQGSDRVGEPNYPSLEAPNLDAPIGAERRATTSPMRPEKMAAGGPPKGPKGKGALLKAMEMFAKRAGKVKNPNVEIPEGFDSFFTRTTPRGGAEIYGVTPDGKEMKIHSFMAMDPSQGVSAEDLAKEISSIYNTGGFSNTPVQQVSLEDLFGPLEGTIEPRRPKASVHQFPSPDIEGEYRVVEHAMPKGNRLRSFQDHLRNIMKADRGGDGYEAELADLALIAEDALSEADYEKLMDEIYGAGLPQAYFIKYAREHKGPKPVIPEGTVEVGPRSLKDVLGIVGEGGNYDVEEVLRMLREGTEGIPDDANPDWLQLRDDVRALTPETLQDQLMDIHRKQGETPIDLRRVSIDELNELQKQGLIPDDIHEQLYDQLHDLENEFADILYDITGDWPDEVVIVPDLELPETYVMEGFSMDTGKKHYFQFDPDQGPRPATPEQIENFTTTRESVVKPQVNKYDAFLERTPPVRMSGTELDDALRRGLIDQSDADFYKESLGDLHDEIGNQLEEFLYDDYGEQWYIDEYDLHVDPNQADTYYAVRAVIKEADTNATLGEPRTFKIQEDSIIEISPDDIPPRFAEGGRVRYAEGGEAEEEEGMTAKQFMRNVGQSLFSAVPFAPEELSLIGADVGEQLYKKTAYPLAGLMSQWWGVNPTTDEFEYAGPFSDILHGRGRPAYPPDELQMIDPELFMEQYERWRDWEDPGETGPIPGIVDETALLPAMPQMIEMMTDLDEIEADPEGYEPSIGAPDWSLTAAERAEENWNRSLERLGLEDPQGFVENTLMSGGMMLGQVPVPIAWANKLRLLLPVKSARVDRVLTNLGRRAGLEAAENPGILSRIAGAGPEFLFPTIEPSQANYLAGALFGGTLMTALDPDEEMPEDLPVDIQELISIMDQGGEEGAEARKVLLEIYNAHQTKVQRAEDQGEERLEEMAGGGKIRKITRRDMLKGLAGTAAAGAAGALGTGKAGVKKGVLTAGDDLRRIEQALDIPAAATKVGNPTRGIEVLREVARRLEELQTDSLDEGRMIMKRGRLHDQDLVDDAAEMAEMFGEDARDFATVADHIEKGEFELAAEVYDSMDTVAREEIYEYLPVDSVDQARAVLAQAGSDWESIPFRLHPDYQKIKLSLDSIDHTSSADAYRHVRNTIDDLAHAGYDTDQLDKWYMRLRNQLPTAEQRRVRKGLEFSPEFDQYTQTKPVPKPKLAGGGKIRKGISRRDVLKGAGAAGTAAIGSALGIGKAGVKKGALEAATAVPKAMPPTAIFSIDQLPKKSRDTVMKWLDLYLENWEQMDPEMKADTMGQRQMRNLDWTRENMGQGFDDMAMHYDETLDFADILEMARDDAIDTVDYQPLDDALQALRGAKALDSETFFDTLAKSALDRPTAFNDWQHRMGIPEEDWIQLPMRGELEDVLPQKQLDAIGELFPDGQIPERLNSGHWDT